MAQAKMVAALQGSSVSARELGLPLAERVLGTGHAGRMGVANCDAAAGPGVLARDHRAPFADRAGGMSVADNTKADVFAGERGASSAEALLGKNGPAELAVSDGLHGKTGAPLVDKQLAGGLSVAGTNADDAFAREDVPVKNHPTWLGVGMGVADGFARQRDMSFGEPLLGKNLPAVQGVAESVACGTDAHLRYKKFFGEAYFARKTGAPPFAELVAADEQGLLFDKVHMMAAGETLGAALSSPHAEQVTIDVLAGVPIAAKAADAGGRGGNLSTVVGIVAASSAVTIVAAGAVTPPVAFATFLLLLGGLFVAVSGVLEDY